MFTSLLTGFILNFSIKATTYSSPWAYIFPIAGLLISSLVASISRRNIFEGMVLPMRTQILSSIATGEPVEKTKIVQHGLPFFSFFERLFIRVIPLLSMLYLVFPLWWQANFSTNYSKVILVLASLTALKFIFEHYKNTSESFLGKRYSDISAMFRV